MKHKMILASLLLCLNTMLMAQNYQWCIDVPVANNNAKQQPRAFLWLPEDCDKVRAVVFSQMNMSEEPIFRHPQFLGTMRRLGFGIVWLAPSLDFYWKVENGSMRSFEETMDLLAQKSGYDCLRTAPVIPIGHSAMATFPWNFAAFAKDRTLAVISYKGDAPRTNLCGYGGDNVEWGRTRNIDGIPSLMIEGELEWWEGRVLPALSFQMKYPESCVFFLCDTGHGHFDVSDEVVDYLCLFLHKTAQYCLAADGTVRRLNRKDGYLCARWDANATRRPKAAPYATYGNQKNADRHEAFWYFDKEMAEATERLYATSLGKKQQYIGYAQDGKLLGYDKQLHAGTIIHPKFLGDGITFHLGAQFTDSTRLRPAASHGTSPIEIRVINGPVTQLDDTTFQVSKYRIGSDDPRRSGDIWLQAVAAQDKHYKGTAQQINITIPLARTTGQRQTIHFPAIQDVAEGTEVIDLKASADSRLPVGYYVKYGPAHIEGSRLVFDKIPPHAKFPIEVSVVAWQYGIEGLWQSAKDVEQTFYILQP